MTCGERLTITGRLSPRPSTKVSHEQQDQATNPPTDQLARMLEALSLAKE